jgi:inner membrane protein
MAIEERRDRAIAAWTQASRFGRSPWPHVLLCLGALVLIGLLDVAQQARRWSVVMTGILDEPAHLLTAALFLAAFLPWRACAAAPWALAGAVLIDLDHVPLYLWGALTAEGSGRPVTHSLTTVLVLACAGVLSRGRSRTILTGLSLGIGLHLVRDLGTGPGVPLWWPTDAHSVRLPYLAYVIALAVVTAVAVGRRTLLHLRARRPAQPR